MDNLFISLDSSDDELEWIPDSYNNRDKKNELTSPIQHYSDNNIALPPKTVKRIKPTLISPNISKQKINDDADDDCFIDEPNDNVNNNEDGEPSRATDPDEISSINCENGNDYDIIDVDQETEHQEPTSTTNNPITESFARLLDVCRPADPSSNMDQLINNIASPPKAVKRIKPTLISPNTSKQKINDDADDDCFIDEPNDNVNNNEDGKPSRDTDPDEILLINCENENDYNIIDVDQETEQQEPSSTTNNPITESFARPLDVCRPADPSSNMDQLINNIALPPKTVKRIKPTLISPNISKQKINDDADDDCFIDEPNDNVNNNEDGKPSRATDAVEISSINCENGNDYDIIDVDQETEQQEPSSTTNNPITESFARLLDVCRLADPSSNMDILINIKLMKYYDMVTPEFINSENFQKIISSAINGIQSNPKDAYLKLSSVLAELYYQQDDDQTTTIQDDTFTSGDDSRRDDQIERLNKAFEELNEKIYELETSEVDLADEENSTFILIEKYKKRACEIYKKISELKGEKKSIGPRLSGPILNTKYEKFNKTIQNHLKRTGNFPDLRDVVRILEFCNRKYNLQLSKDEMKVISEEAFIVIGRTLQKRRKLELFKTLNFYSEGSMKDPAAEDAALQSKLNENRRYYSSINDVINKYAALDEKSSNISISSTSNVGTIELNENHGEGPITISDEEDLGSKEKETGQEIVTDDPPMLVIISDDE